MVSLLNGVSASLEHQTFYIPLKNHVFIGSCSIKSVHNKYLNMPAPL